MNVDHLLTSTATVTIRTTGGRAADGFGDPAVVETTRTFRCWLSQKRRSENTQNENTQNETWDLYLDASAAAVDGLDKVTVGGIDFELDGPPWPALNPRTQVITHVECTVRRSQ